MHTRFLQLRHILVILCSSTICTANAVEVFFLAGQSNADGSNSFYFDNGDPSKGGGLSAANASYADPYTGVEFAYAHASAVGSASRYLTRGFGALEPASWGMMGPEISLGRQLDTLLVEDVALIKYTAPGTSLGTQWGPDDNLLYQDMVSFFNDQLADLATRHSEVNLNTFFWHQGESDSGATYEADFNAMKSALTTDLASPNLQFVLGEISENFDPGNTGNTPRSTIVAVNQALNNVAASDPNVVTTGPQTSIPLHDYIHFDANGQITHGMNMALAWQNGFGAPVPEPSTSFFILLSLGFLLRRKRGWGAMRVST